MKLGNGGLLGNTAALNAALELDEQDQTKRLRRPTNESALGGGSRSASSSVQTGASTQQKIGTPVRPGDPSSR